MRKHKKMQPPSLSCSVAVSSGTLFLHIIYMPNYERIVHNDLIHTFAIFCKDFLSPMVRFSNYLKINMTLEPQFTKCCIPEVWTNLVSFCFFLRRQNYRVFNVHFSLSLSRCMMAAFPLIEKNVFAGHLQSTWRHLGAFTL